MQYLDGWTCSECKDSFTSASSLLKHFAVHAGETENILAEEINHENTDHLSKKTIPDLHPIVKNSAKVSFTEVLNPITFCEVSITEDNSQNDQKRNDLTDGKAKKYQCTFCQKCFGWSTDLKRHILTHTGERPFQCDLCSRDFTRNFLLQKHINKCHKRSVPDLKPIYVVLKSKTKNSSQKSFKSNNSNKNYSSNMVYEIIENSICSS